MKPVANHSLIHLSARSHEPLAGTGAPGCWEWPKTRLRPWGRRLRQRPTPNSKSMGVHAVRRPAPTKHMASGSSVLCVLSFNVAPLVDRLESDRADAGSDCCVGTSRGPRQRGRLPHYESTRLFQRERSCHPQMPSHGSSVLQLTTPFTTQTARSSVWCEARGKPDHGVAAGPVGLCDGGGQRHWPRDLLGPDQARMQGYGGHVKVL